MKIRMWGVLWMGLCLLSLNAQEAGNKYLKKVLHNLEQIKSATYRGQSLSWMPGDTIPDIYYKYYHEYDNPGDTIIGASYVSFEDTARNRMTSGYDGIIRATVYEEHKGVMIDDFSTNKLPFRLVANSFFHYAKNILAYTLTTSDSISTTFEDLGEEYYFKLLVHEDEQVEFFGKAYHIPNHIPISDPTSQYEMWIKKGNDLPYQIKRTMSYNTSMMICTEVELNTLSLSDFDLYSHFPEGYEVRRKGEKRKEQPKVHPLLDMQAPAWNLRNTDEKPVSLSDCKSKVIVLNFTGVGCAPCKVAIPFLNSLQEKYSSEEVSVIAIESWRRKMHSIRAYIHHEKIKYPLLEGNEEVLKAYLGNDRAVPQYFMIDGNRKVRKILKGYSSSITDKEITDMIDECLGESH